MTLGLNLIAERNLATDETKGKKEAQANEGTFAPEHPTMRWRFEKRALSVTEGSYTVLLVFQEQSVRPYEIRIEFFETAE